MYYLKLTSNIPYNEYYETFTTSYNFMLDHSDFCSDRFRKS
ncbi:hypothetical protein MARI151_10033 [Maribacter litoralis]|uniref:Uncharacterized protein n=1 Tax=Maribacter litoralis TaxID=2059726 RepID=A0A653LIT4_9FLAO|nr:hypothetical protein MARI151_10033 [Maribacter litoralis]